MDRRQYLNHFMVLFSGTAAAQILNLASYPLIARLYSPEDFGIFATFVAVSAIPGAIACGRFDLAVPTAPNAGRFAILWLCVLFASLMGVVSAIGGAIYWWGVEGVFDPVRPLLLGLCVFFTGFCAAGALFLMRHDWYRVNSASLLARTSGVVLLQIGLAVLWPEPLSLILGYTAGFAIQAAIFAWTIHRHIPPGPPRARPMRAMFRRYKRQVSADLPGTLIGALTLHSTPFLIQLLYGPAAVGFYALGQRLAVLPLQLFNDALGQIFFQKAARAQQERGEFWRELKFNLVLSGVIAIGAAVAIPLLAYPAITIYLGSEWERSATILIILVPMLALRSVTMSIASMVFVIGKAHWLLIHNIASLGILLLTFASAWLLDGSLEMFLTTMAALSALEFALFGAILIKAAHRRRLGDRANATASMTAPPPAGQA